MLRLKTNSSNICKALLLFALASGLTGCRPLSDFFDPAKRTPKKQLKVVKRDKPNLTDETVSREVDPDGDDLIEATEEDAANDKAAQNNNPAPATPTPQNADLAQVEKRAKSIIGRWEVVDDAEKTVLEFTASQRDGETFVGKFNYYGDGNTLIESSTYVVSREQLIKLIKSGGESQIEAVVAPDGKSMRLTERGAVKNLIREGSGTKDKSDDVPTKPVPQQPATTPRKPEIPDQD